MEPVDGPGILSNKNRAVFAEFLVASALGATQKPRIEWDAVDLRFENITKHFIFAVKHTLKLLTRFNCFIITATCAIDPGLLLWSMMMWPPSTASTRSAFPRIWL
jgi:hypothetical protein